MALVCKLTHDRELVSGRNKSPSSASISYSSSRCTHRYTGIAIGNCKRNALSCTTRIRPTRGEQSA